MWIAWSDQEPEHGKQILVSGLNHNRPGAGRWVDAVWYDGFDFYDEEESMVAKDEPAGIFPPTHWQPLPEPPTE